MENQIVIDCKVANVTTNWPKNELKINLAATVQAAEYEVERLGEIARMDHPVRVKIHRRDQSIDTALSLVANVESVRTDHKSEQDVIVISTHTTLETAGQAESLGTLAYRDVEATARFERQQMSLELPASLRGAKVELRTFSNADPDTGELDDGEPMAEDPLLNDAIEIVNLNGGATVSMLQRRLRIGYPRAARLFDVMVERDIVHPGQKDPEDVQVEGEALPEEAEAE